MTIYQALAEMRTLSKRREEFSFSYMSYNSSSQSSNGVVVVPRARLRKRPMAKYHKSADIIEEYLDLTTLEPRRFYQPLLMTFNNQHVTL